MKSSGDCLSFITTAPPGNDERRPMVLSIERRRLDQKRAGRWNTKPSPSQFHVPTTLPAQRDSIAPENIDKSALPEKHTSPCPPLPRFGGEGDKTTRHTSSPTARISAI